ncbi:MAG: hypothetical protein MRJ68_02435 [Nitrospira sp.]|nr:hypothetical protein [Nitrospira sp.]
MMPSSVVPMGPLSYCRREEDGSPSSATFGDYVLKMPRGAQVLYPKDLAIIPMWADIYPGARVFERIAGLAQAALTMALLRAVGPDGVVVTYEVRDDFASTAAANISRYINRPTLSFRKMPMKASISLTTASPLIVALLDLPEPGRLSLMRLQRFVPGGIYLSFVPTVHSSHAYGRSARASHGIRTD